MIRRIVFDRGGSAVLNLTLLHCGELILVIP